MRESIASSTAFADGAEAATYRCAVFTSVAGPAWQTQARANRRSIATGSRVSALRCVRDREAAYVPAPVHPQRGFPDLSGLAPVAFLSSSFCQLRRHVMQKASKMPA